MQFRIADTFTDSLVRLTGDEQKAAKTTAFDLQVNSAHPGLQLHKLDGANPNPAAAVLRDARDAAYHVVPKLTPSYSLAMRSQNANTPST